MGPEIARAKNGTSLAEQIMLLGRLASQSAEVETSYLNSFKLPVTGIYPETGLEDIDRDFLEADLWPGIISG